MKSRICLGEGESVSSVRYPLPSLPDSNSELKAMATSVALVKLSVLQNKMDRHKHEEKNCREEWVDRNCGEVRDGEGWK